MEQYQAIKLFGLAEVYSQAEIESVYLEKLKLLEQKHDNAPTDVLKAKFAEMISQLGEARQQLLAVLPKPSQANNPLSQTKLADLPSTSSFDSSGIHIASSMNISPGQVLLSRYEIKEQIGAGGMGAVYRAFDQNRSEDIAIKVLLPALTQNKNARERFLNEARLSSKLSHPNIVNVFDVQQEGELYFITMELLTGKTLRQSMDEVQLSGGNNSEEEAIALIIPIIEALEYAHQYSVHRDIKPENIFITNHGDYKIMDFGIARLMSNSQASQTSSAMGTAYYMAPEQLKPGGEVDHRADIYSLGVILYEFLTGELPAGKYRPVNKLRSDVSKNLVRTIDRCLEFNPSERFASANELRSGIAKQSMKLPKLNLKPIVSAVLVTIITILAFTFYNEPSVMDAFRSLLPESKQDIKQKYTQALRLDGQVKELRERLKSLEQNNQRSLIALQNEVKRLTSKISDSNQHSKRIRLQNELKSLNGKESKASYINKILNEFVFNGEKIKHLRGEDRLAEGLLRDKEYTDAIISLEEISKGYQQLIASIENAEIFVDSKKSSSRALAKVISLATTNDLLMMPQVKNLKQLDIESIKLAEEVRFDRASSIMVEIISTSIQLAKEMKSAVYEKNNAGQRREKWHSYASSKNLLGLDESIELEKNYNDQLSNLKGGKLNVAKTNFRQLATEFNSLLDSSRNALKFYNKANLAKSKWDKFLSINKITDDQDAIRWKKELIQSKQAYDQGEVVKAGLSFRSITNNLKERLIQYQNQLNNLNRAFETLSLVCRYFSVNAKTGFLQKECKLNQQRQKGTYFKLDELKSELGHFVPRLPSWNNIAKTLKQIDLTLAKITQNIDKLTRYKNRSEAIKSQLVGITPLLQKNNLQQAQQEIKRIQVAATDLLAKVSVTLAAYRIKIILKDIGGFKLSSREVSTADFKVFVEATGYVSTAEQALSDGCWGQINRRWLYSRKINWKHPGFSQKENHPVVCISYVDAIAFITWLNSETHTNYRLPTESEFEIAARAGTNNKYYWGNNISPGKANCQGCGRKSSNIHTMNVASFPPNSFGIYDILGNAWELTDNCWSTNKSQKLANGNNCESVVAKGGGWNSDPNYILPTSRLKLKKAAQVKADVGFRLAAD